MAEVVYTIVEHDGGWAYKVDGVFSETFPNREAAQVEANSAAARQGVPGETEAISWQDPAGGWHDEVDDGGDRPLARVVNDRSIPIAAQTSSRTRPAALRVNQGGQPVPALTVLLVALLGYVAARILVRR